MPFGAVIIGSPGAGKSTLCAGYQQVRNASSTCCQILTIQFLAALGRPCYVVNLDPAVSDPPYDCSLNITSLISLQDAMDEHGLGPNGAMLYCVEYLEANFDWLEEGLEKMMAKEKGNGYVIFDTPGQVELWTNHDSMKRIVQRLTKSDYRVSALCSL